MSLMRSSTQAFSIDSIFLGARAVLYLPRKFARRFLYCAKSSHHRPYYIGGCEANLRAAHKVDDYPRQTWPSVSQNEGATAADSVQLSYSGEPLSVLVRVFTTEFYAETTRRTPCHSPRKGEWHRP